MTWLRRFEHNKANRAAIPWRKKINAEPHARA